MSKLTKDQKKTFTKQISNSERMKVTVRYDDECDNGHNTFAITADLSEHGRLVACGCLHDDIAKHFPELAHLIKWHLVSNDGPMHYVANTTYYARGISGKPDIDTARRCAVWPDATTDQLCSEGALKARLPTLLAEFKSAVESLEFIY